MSLYLSIKHIYPEINDNDFVIYNDGTGEVILRWDSKLPLPSASELNSVLADVELKGAKDRKISELNEKCDETIIGTFPYEINGVTYYFYCDMVAQSNFEKVDRAFDKGRITQYPWTGYDANGNVVRLVFTAETFGPFYTAHLNHISSTIVKFRDNLQPLVESATKVEEIEAITWK